MLPPISSMYYQLTLSLLIRIVRLRTVFSLFIIMGEYCIFSLSCVVKIRNHGNQPWIAKSHIRTPISDFLCITNDDVSPICHRLRDIRRQIICMTLNLTCRKEERDKIKCKYTNRKQTSEFLCTRNDNICSAR